MLMTCFCAFTYFCLMSSHAYASEGQSTADTLLPLQERLRTLRASLGSFKAPPAEEGPRAHQRLAVPTAAQSRSALLNQTPPRKRADKSASDAPSHAGALTVLAPTRRVTSNTLERAGSGPEAADNSPEVGQGSEMRGRQATGRLLECQAVQGLCQLLEHHVAVLEQSQQPVGNMLQSEATQNGKLLPDLLHVRLLCQFFAQGFTIADLHTCKVMSTRDCLGSLLLIPQLFSETSLLCPQLPCPFLQAQSCSSCWRPRMP